MRKLATKRLRAPVAQSQACVFSFASSIPTLVKGNMRCVNLRYNAQRTVLSDVGYSNTSRGSLFAPSSWLYFRHIGRTSNFAFTAVTNITLVDPSVKIRERMHNWNLQNDNSNPSFSTVSDYVIARF